MFKTIIEPRFCETDALGHINNTVLPVWFEQARSDIFDLVHPSLILDEWPMILAKIDVSFLEQIYFGKPVEITTGISHLGRKSFTILHRAFQENKLVSEGHAVIVWFDRKLQASAPFPQNIRTLLTAHLQES